MLHGQLPCCVVCNPVIAEDFYLGGIYFTLQMSEKNLGTLVTPNHSPTPEIGGATLRTGTVVQCGKFEGPGLQTLLRAEFQEAMNCAWILGSPRRLLLACSYHTGNAGREKRQHVERWDFGGLLIPFYNEISGPEAMNRGQLHPLATLIPLSSPACQACSNKTTHNRSFEYPTYRCLLYRVEITILYSSRFCCFSS